MMERLMLIQKHLSDLSLSLRAFHVILTGKEIEVYLSP